MIASTHRRDRLLQQINNNTATIMKLLVSVITRNIETKTANCVNATQIKQNIQISSKEMLNYLKRFHGNNYRNISS